MDDSAVSVGSSLLHEKCFYPVCSIMIMGVGLGLGLGNDIIRIMQWILSCMRKFCIVF
jgi:hypothetical protein